MLFSVPKVIGHRGAAGYAPENTIASFAKAKELGCFFIEFDVMCSEDGEPFVIHDERLKRTTNGKGDVGTVDAAYLKTLDAGSWFSRAFTRAFKGEPIPHFHDVLQWLTDFDMQANIEIKPYPGAVEQTTTKVLSAINQYWPEDKPLPLVSSFEWEALRLSRSIMPEIPLGLLFHEWDTQWLSKAQKIDCYSIHVNRKILSFARIKEIKEHGYPLYAYTVNRKRLANKLLRCGVDAVFSDYPDLLS